MNFAAMWRHEEDGMDKGIEFSVRPNVVSNRDGDQVVSYSVVEEGPHRRDVSTWWTDTKAKLVASLLRKEHKNGRVAQAHCAKGHACDRDRIHDPRRLGTLRDAVILCEEHAAEIDRETAPRAA